MEKSKILFLCVHNSARSQMAQGILRELYGDKFEAFSAGTEPRKVSYYAIKVMEEVGIDISKQKAKLVDEFAGKNFDYVITLCHSAKENCPFFPGSKLIHWNLKDPAEKRGSEKEVMEEFRKTRKKIKHKIERTFTKNEQGR